MHKIRPRDEDMPDIARDLVFISYHPEDRPWLSRLVLHLMPLLRPRALAPWNDTCVAGGADVAEETERALRRARVLLLLVSADYLASPEFDRALAAARAHGIRMLWLPVRASAYEQTELACIRPLLDPIRPLASRAREAAEMALLQAAQRITQAMIGTSKEGDPGEWGRADRAASAALAVKAPRLPAATTSRWQVTGGFGLLALGIVVFKLASLGKPPAVELSAQRLSDQATQNHNEMDDMGTPISNLRPDGAAAEPLAAQPPVRRLASRLPRVPVLIAGDEDEEVRVERNHAAVAAGRIQRDSRGHLLFRVELPEGLYTIRCHSGTPQQVRISVAEPSYVQCQ